MAINDHRLDYTELLKKKQICKYFVYNASKKMNVFQFSV